MYRGQLKRRLEKMTDVEKIKTYLSIEDAQEQSYYLKEIMPISPKR